MRAVRKRIRRGRTPGGLRAVRLCALGVFGVAVQRFTTISWKRVTVWARETWFLLKIDAVCFHALD